MLKLTARSLAEPMIYFSILSDLDPEGESHKCIRINADTKWCIEAVMVGGIPLIGVETSETDKYKWKLVALLGFIDGKWQILCEGERHYTIDEIFDVISDRINIDRRLGESADVGEDS